MSVAEFDEAAAVSEIKARAERVAPYTSGEASRVSFREQVHRMLTDGVMPYSEALRMVAHSHEDIDIALREHIAGYITAGLPVPEELRFYTGVALFHAPVTYPAGNVPVDDMNRNFTVSALVRLALELWPHLKHYRGRHAKRPSACSLVADALGMGEDRVEQIVREHLNGKVARKIAAS